MRRPLYAFAVMLIALIACTESSQLVQMPTLAAIPSDTASPTQTFTLTNTATDTVTPSITPSPTVTWTPNLDTQVVQAKQTNEAGEATLTWMAWSPTPTSTASDTLTPSQTITNTITPTASPSFTPASEAVQAMQPQLMYVRSVANVRTCPRTRCDSLTHLRERDTITVTGTVNGEVLNRGNSLWYRVNYNSQEAYIWSGLVSNILPTPITPTQTPPRQIIYPTSTPIYSAPDVPEYHYATEPPISSGSGPTALCNDGTYSYSAHHQGTCSHHHGVAVWYR